MTHTRLCIAIVTLGGAAAAPAIAQLVPPAPSKTPATPEYQPPKPPPPPPPHAAPPQPTPGAAPAANDKPLPSLIQKDQAGKILPLALPVDEASVRLLDLDDQAKAKVEKSIATRRDEIDRLVIEKIDTLTGIRKTMANLPESPDMELMRSTTMSARAFSNSNKLLDRLVKDGALTPSEKSRATSISREYSEARKQQIVGEVGHDVMKMVQPAFVMTMEEALADVNMSLDRMLADAAPNQVSLLAKVDMPADMRAEVDKRLAGLKNKPAAGSTAAQHAVTTLRSVFFDVLKPDQQRALLTAANPRLFEEKAADTKAAEQPAPASPKK